MFGTLPFLAGKLFQLVGSGASLPVAPLEELTGRLLKLAASSGPRIGCIRTRPQSSNSGANLRLLVPSP